MTTSPTPTALDPITVEIIGSAFSSIVEEMGMALIRASYSTNIKERRDCSTILFDAQGRTLAQAEHIPIHLGSLMGIVEEVLQRHPLETLRPGDMFIGNDAYTGRISSCCRLSSSATTSLRSPRTSRTTRTSLTAVPRISIKRAYGFHRSRSLTTASCSKTCWN